MQQVTEARRGPAQTCCSGTTDGHLHPDCLGYLPTCLPIYLPTCLLVRIPSSPCLPPSTVFSATDVDLEVLACCSRIVVNTTSHRRYLVRPGCSPHGTASKDLAPGSSVIL